MRGQNEVVACFDPLLLTVSLRERGNKVAIFLESGWRQIG